MKKTLHNMMLPIIESRIWIAFGAVGVVISSYQMSRFDISFPVLAVVFLGTWLMYFLQRHIPKKQWNVKDRTVQKQVLLVGISFLFVYSYFNQRPGFEVYGWMMLFCLPAFFYAIRISYNEKTFLGLRHVPHLKIIMVVLVWMFLVLLPWVEYGVCDQIPIGYATMMLLYLIAIIIPFDIRDMMTDDPSIQTVAQHLGERKSLLFCCALIIGAMACAVWLMLNGLITPLYLLAYLLILLITFILIVCKPKNAGTLYYEGLLDGTLLLWGIFILV